MNSAYSYFVVALDLIGTDKVEALFRQLGYAGKVSPQACMEVLEQEGERFSKPFGKLAMQAAKTPVAKAKFLNAAQLSKASGKTATTATTAATDLTATQKSEAGMQWFSQISNLLLGGLSSVDDIVNATNGTNGKFYNRQKCTIIKIPTHCSVPAR